MSAGSMITPTDQRDWIVNGEDTILVTGAAGFIGQHLVKCLLNYGFANLRCLVRPSSDCKPLQKLLAQHPEGGRVELITGDLLCQDNCNRITDGARLIYHLAAGTGTKSCSDAFLNSVVATRNLIEAALGHKCLRRLLSLSSFAVYSNRNNPGSVLDESCPVEENPGSRSEAYCYGKVKQDELVMDYGTNRGLPYVLVRPGVVYGPGKHSLTGRVGIDTFGIFLHLGGGNPIPLTYVENCAEAILLAGLKKGLEGHVFNVVDDELPSSRKFLRLYKQNVRRFRSIYVPHAISFLFCWLWEKYSHWSEGQLPPVFTRREWSAYWKRTRYSNEKLKRQVGWTPRVPTHEGLRSFFESCRSAKTHA